MYYYLFPVLIVLASVVEGVVAENTNSTLVRCGTQDPPAALLDISNSKAVSTSAETDRAIEVGLYIHVVESQDTEGIVTIQMLDKQVGS